METILWLAFSAGVIWGLFNSSRVICFFIDTFGQKKPKPELLPIPKQDFTDWKKITAEGKNYKKQQHKDWLDEAWAILRRNCTRHIYHYQNWYTCLLCGEEEPWEYKEGCRCNTVADKLLTDQTMTFRLVERQAWCPHHGRDYSSFPLSDRSGNVIFGSNRREYTDSYKRSDELQQYVNKNRVRFDIPEGTK